MTPAVPTTDELTVTIVEKMHRHMVVLVTALVVIAYISRPVILAIVHGKQARTEHPRTKCYVFVLLSCGHVMTMLRGRQNEHKKPRARDQHTMTGLARREFSSN